MTSTDESNGVAVPEPDEIGRLFPAYEVESRVAAGGMGAVYKARQTSLDRDVAIKVLPREFAEDADFRSAFEAEAKQTARLNHPNLISIYDFGEVDGLLFIVSEFVSGGSLFQSAHGTAIDPAEAGRIVAEVCDGLAHAHEHGILHRDVRPSNILLTSKVRPKLGDFGLARLDGGRDHPGQSAHIATQYVAPESVTHPDRADPRADLFSLGVVFHELLTGTTPADDPRPPSQIAGCDPRFDVIVARATHPDPAMRYPDAATMARELRELLDALAGPKLRSVRSVPRRVMPPPRPTRSSRPVSRPSSAAPWIVLLVIGILIAVAVVVARKESKPPPASQAPPVRAEPEPAPAPPPDPAPAGTPVEVPPLELPDPEPEPAVTADRPEPEPESIAMAPDDPAEPDAEPEAEPEPGPGPAAFDVADWLEMARDKMRDKAAPLIAEVDRKLERNLESFRRDVNRSLRSLNNNRRDFMEERAEEMFDKLREEGFRIPRRLDFGLEERALNSHLTSSARERINVDLGEALAGQESIDREFASQMSGFSETYVLGIEFQIDRLEESGDEAAIEALREEIDATREEPARFVRLMRGLDPDPPAVEVGEDDEAAPPAPGPGAPGI